MASNPYQSSNLSPPERLVEQTIFSRLRQVLLATLVTIGMGAMVVVLIPPFNFAALIVWLPLVMWLARCFTEPEPRSLVLTLVCGLLMAGIIAAAWRAPFKTKDKLLAQRVSLPKLDLTLGELEEYRELYGRDVFPSLVYITAPDDQKDVTISFASQQPTLREFVATVESQSSLRHRFSSCGNGWTVLYGADCGFGLDLSSRER